MVILCADNRVTGAVMAYPRCRADFCPSLHAAFDHEPAAQQVPRWISGRINLPAQLSANTRTETLPPETTAGLRAEGTRTTEIIPAGTAGNNREIAVISETWTSPVLKITLRQMTDDPRTGKVTMEVTSMDRAAPDPALFKVPEGYAVMEL